LGDARQPPDQRRAERAAPIPRSRPAPCLRASRRLEEEFAVESDANAQYDAYRARARMKDWPALRPSAQPAPAADGPRRQGQPHRPRLQPGARDRRLDSGL